MYILGLVGQIIFGGYFLYNAYNHFRNHAGMTGYAMSKGMPKAGLAVYASGVMLAVGGLAVLTGIKVVLGMWVLVAFLIATNYKMHAFWKETDPMAKMMEKVQFTKNLGLIGALLIMISMLS